MSFSQARAVVMGVAGLAVVVYQVVTNGLITFIVSKEETQGILVGGGTVDATVPLYAASDKAGGVLTAFVSQGLVFVALFVILYSRRYKHWPAPTSLLTDWVWRLFITALVVANVVMNNPIGNGRFWSMLVVAALLSVYMPYRRPRSVKVFIAGALLVLLFIFTSLDLFRTTTESVDLDVAGPSETLTTDCTYAMFQMELNGIEYLEDEPHTWAASS